MHREGVERCTPGVWRPSLLDNINNLYTPREEEKKKKGGKTLFEWI